MKKKGNHNDNTIKIIINVFFFFFFFFFLIYILQLMLDYNDSINKELIIINRISIIMLFFSYF